MRFRKPVLFAGLAMSGLAVLSLLSGSIPFVGVLLLFHAPDVLLIGVFLIALSFLLGYRSSLITAVVVAAIVTSVVGLNTRLPSLMLDASRVWHEQTIVEPLRLRPGDPVHVETNESTIRARNYAYDSAKPVCNEGMCMVAVGFRMPAPNLGIDYWNENVSAVVERLGLTKARPGEVAPTVAVKWTSQSNLAALSVRITSEHGKELAALESAYRNGFPLESVDSGRSRSRNEALLALQFLMHGNSMNRWVGRALAKSPREPLGSFLRQAIRVQVTEPAVKDVIVLEDRTFTPDREVSDEEREHIHGGARRAKCDEFLKRDDANGGWLVFRSDLQGRLRIPNEIYVFCDADAVWAVSRVPRRKQVFVSKYTPDGRKQFEGSFEQPDTPMYYSGGLIVDSLKEEDGSVIFVWFIAKSQGPRGLYVNRELRLAMPM